MYVEHETENITKEGKHIWISWTNRLVYDESGEPVELQSVGFDISKRKKLEEELRFLASVDPLTGALNRQSFFRNWVQRNKTRCSLQQTNFRDCFQIGLFCRSAR